jgi:hypothetical protein
MNLFPSRLSRGLLLAGGALLALPGLALAQGVSNGTAVIVGAEHGKPVIVYEDDAGTAPNNGITAMSGNDDGGARLIPGRGAAGSFADGGIPFFTGQEDGGAPQVAYLEPHPAAVVPPALAQAAPVPQPPAPRAPLPPQVPAELQAARAALAANRLAEGRQDIEQAQTALLNARQEGETGWRQPVRQLEAALQALDRHDAQGAKQALEALRLPA